LRKKSTRNLGELRVQDLGRGSHPDDRLHSAGARHPKRSAAAMSRNARRWASWKSRTVAVRRSR